VACAKVCTSVDQSSKLLSQHSFSTQESKTRESYDRTLLLFTSKAGRAALRCYQSAADSPVVANMTGREPVNIRRLLRENDQYAAADEYARDVQKGDAVSSWHEHQSRKSSRPEQMPPQNLQSVDLKVVACSPKDRLQRKYVLSVWHLGLLHVCQPASALHFLQAC